MKPSKAVVADGPTAEALWNEGRLAVAQSGCQACHRSAERQPRPGPHLTHIAADAARAIERTLVNPTAPMPSFKNLPPKKFEAIVNFLSTLK